MRPQGGNVLDNNVKLNNIGQWAFAGMEALDSRLEFAYEPGNPSVSWFPTCKMKRMQEPMILAQGYHNQAYVFKKASVSQKR